MNRSTLLLLALLAVLGVIVYLVLPSGDESISTETRTPAAFTVDSASIVRLQVERPGSKLVIENVGGRWTITSHGNLQADPARVTEIIGGLSRFRTGSLVSTNAAKQSLFQVDSAGSVVTLTDRSGGTHSIVIGKMGPSFSEVYFRLPGATDVYLGSGITTWSLERDVKEWRDRTVFAAPPEAITGLTISSGGKSRAFHKDSTGWKSGGEPVATETINPILTTLSSLRAEDFIDSSVQFSGTPSRVVVEGAIGATMDIYRMGSDTNRYAVQTSSSAQKFIVGRYATSQLLKPLGESRPSGVAAVKAKAEPVPSITRAGGDEEQAADDRSAGTGSREARPAESRPADTRRSEPPPRVVPAPTPDRTEPPVKTDVARESAPPETKPAPSTTVNPFKQKSPTERQPTGGTTTQQTPARSTDRQAPPASQPSGRTGTQTQTQQQSQSRTDAAKQSPVRTPAQPPAREPAPAQGQQQGGVDDEGDLTVHLVKQGETMTSIARQYGVTVEQVLKWNLLKSISVKPGQELYIFVRK